METREKYLQEIRLYVLRLNPMDGSAESAVDVAVSTDYQKLVDWYREQLNPGGLWRDDNWGKTFRAGSPLEWYNPAYNLELNNLGLFGHGIYDTWIPVDNLNEIQSRFNCIYMD